MSAFFDTGIPNICVDMKRSGSHIYMIATMVTVDHIIRSVDDPSRILVGPTAYCAVQPGVVGICEVVKEAYPDETAMDPKSPKYDPKATSDNPRWFMVDVKLVRSPSLQACKLLQHA